MRSIRGLLQLIVLLVLISPGGTVSAETGGDRPILLGLGLGSSSFQAKDRIAAYYRDTEFLGEAHIEYTPWPGVALRPFASLSYLVLPFDQAGFDEYEGLDPGGRVDANSGKMVLSSIGMRGFILSRAPVQPYLQIALVSGTFKEKYQYGELIPGPIFPSGTLKGRNSTISYLGLGLGGGVRLNLAREFQPYFAVDLIWLKGGGSDISLVPIRGGVVLVIDERD